MSENLNNISIKVKTAGVTSVKNFLNDKNLDLANEAIAHVLNSSLNKTEIKQVKSDIDCGLTKLLYVAPESLSKRDNINFLSSKKISFVAIDEAHCISEWGHDFRPEYRNLKKITSRLRVTL